MATNPKSDIPPQGELQKTDDLTIIPGVSKALEQWLRESLKVYTFADLTKLSAQKIRARGKQTGEVISIEELEPILARARELAEESSASAPESTPPTKPENAPPAKAKSEKASAAPKTTKEWSDFANFVVCFERKNVGGKEEKRTKVEHRTGIQHMETGEQASWPGVETDEACKWILQRLGEETNSIVETVPEKPILKSTPPLASETTTLFSATIMEITGIQVFQPPLSDQPQNLFIQNQSFNGFVKSNEPLSLAVTFQLCGENAPSITKKGLEYGVVFNSQDLFTSTTSRLGVSKPEFLKEGQLIYTACLSPLTISPGVHHLKIIATVRDASPLWASAEAPLLQVA